MPADHHRCRAIAFAIRASVSVVPSAGRDRTRPGRSRTRPCRAPRMGADPCLVSRHFLRPSVLSKKDDRRTDAPRAHPGRGNEDADQLTVLVNSALYAAPDPGHLDAGLVAEVSEQAAAKFGWPPRRLLTGMDTARPARPPGPRVRVGIHVQDGSPERGVGSVGMA